MRLLRNAVSFSLRPLFYKQCTLIYRQNLRSEQKQDFIQLSLLLSSLLACILVLLYALLQAATIHHFYSLVMGTGKVNRYDAGCFQTVWARLPANWNSSADLLQLYSATRVAYLDCIFLILLPFFFPLIKYKNLLLLYENYQLLPINYPPSSFVSINIINKTKHFLISNISPKQ